MITNQILKNFLLAGILWFVAVTPSWALVDMRNANYSNTWIDLQLTNRIKLSRTYNSRTMFTGIFGFGWCSDLETSLKWDHGTVVETSCGAGHEDRYEFTTDALVVLQGLGIKALETPAILNKEPSRLKGHRLSLRSSIPGVGGLSLSSTGFVSDDGAWAFDLDGHLLKGLNFPSVEGGRSTSIEIERTDKKITKVRFPGNGYLTFTYPDKLHMLVECNPGEEGKDTKLPIIKYVFENGNLVSMTNAWTNTYTYEYDNLHDLTRAVFPDGTDIALQYDTKHDWVVMFKDRENCRERYIYTTRSKDDYGSETFKTCGNTVVSHSIYTFHHLNRGTTKYLAEASSVINSKRTTVTYDYTGKPIKIVEGDEGAEHSEVVSVMHRSDRIFRDNSNLMAPEPIVCVPRIDNEGNRFSGVYVLASGGDEVSLLQSVPKLKTYITLSRTKTDYKGFYALREQFTVAEDISSLAESKTDGIAVEGTNLTGVKYAGEIFEIGIKPDTGELLVKGAGIGIKEATSLDEIASKLPRDVTEKVNEALMYGGQRQRIVAHLE